MTDSREKSVRSETIPAALVDREQWICWRVKDRDGKETKVPIVPSTGEYASATDPETWRSFNEALESLEDDTGAGIGFVFTEDDPFVGIDLDDCRDPETGSPSTDAREIILELESFTEVSPSRTGYHVIVRGSLPGDRSRRGSVEMYETARFFTVTGDHVDATPTRVSARSDALESVYNEYIAATDSSAESGQQTLDADHAPGDDVSTGTSSQQPTLKDEELLEKARSASNGKKFNRLWRGSTTGYDSQSEADMALCCLLAFWTGGDAAQVDRLFRKSGLIRQKWDDVHYNDGSTYGEKTVERAIANTDDVYEPSSRDQKHAEKDVKQETRDRTTSSGQTVGGTDGARAAYLVEKNQLLSERVSDLEATLEQKNERLEELETKLEALKTKRENRDRKARPTDKEQTANTDKDNETSESTSAWDRVKRLVGSRSEDR